jgi:hypothetical protein
MMHFYWARLCSPTGREVCSWGLIGEIQGNIIKSPTVSQIKGGFYNPVYTIKSLRF